MRDIMHPRHDAYEHRSSSGWLALFLLTVAVAATLYGLIVLGSAAKEILVAVIAASASLLSAVFAYAFQRARDMEKAARQRERELESAAIQRERELELAAIRHRRELDLAAKKIKQDNYTRILEKLAPYIRNPTAAGDEFTTAYLHAWVVGSIDVLREVDEFLKKRDWKSLDRLLGAMREDLALELGESLEGLSSIDLFPTPPSPGGLQREQ